MAGRADDALMGRIRGAYQGETRTGPDQADDMRGPSRPPVQSIEGYELLSEVHRGGQGVVYKAVQKATKRTVALKVLLEGPYASARQRHRFEREIDLVASLQHPNIVTVYDSGVTRDGRHYFAMEYIHGQPLDAYRPHVALGAALVFLLANFAIVVLYKNASIAVELARGDRAIASEKEQRRRAEKKILETRKAKKVAEDLTEALYRSLYYERLNLALFEHNRNNSRGLKRVLDKCSHDLRSWEWYRLRWLSDTSMQTLSFGDGERAMSAALTPDATRIVFNTLGEVVLMDTMPLSHASH